MDRLLEKVRRGEVVTWEDIQEFLKGRKGSGGEKDEEKTGSRDEEDR